jgi:DNA-binding transcriptional MerR regulator
VSRPANARSHRSIGEVLSLLQEEYPDITISKIRFLESQGLLDPERTPSGYRKFYDPDIKRLRWILYQQKEHYLPLKVIKERLDQQGSDPARRDDATQRHGQQRLLAGDDVGDLRDALAPEDAPAPEPRSGVRATVRSRDDRAVGAQTNGHTRNGAIGHQHDRGSTTARAGTPAANGAMGPASSRPPPPTPPGDTRAGAVDAASGRSDPTSVSLSLDELSEASGVSARDIHHLERFGLIEARDLGDERVYYGDALTVARVAARFMQHGIEARHMRTYKVAVDREASLFEQIVLPVLKQRNPEARRRAAHTVAELVDLGDVLRSALLRRELRHYLDDKD